MLKFINRKSDERGSVMIEMIAMLGLITMVSPMMYKQAAQRNTELSDITIANHTRAIMEGVNDYINAHYADIRDQKTVTCSSSCCVTDKAVSYATANTVQKFIIDANHFCEFMAPGVKSSSKDIAAYKVAIKRDATTGTVAVTGMIAGSKSAGGAMTAIDRQRGSRIASLIGAHGGYVNTNNANGAQGTWTLAVSDYFGAGSVNATGSSTTWAPGNYSIVATTQSTGMNTTNDFLYREGQMDKSLNTMKTTLYMAQNNIENINTAMMQGLQVKAGNAGPADVANFSVDSAGNTEAKGTLKVDGATTLGGTLGVTGTTTLNGMTTVNADFFIKNGATDVLKVERGTNLLTAPNTNVNGDLMVTGLLDVADLTNLQKALTVGGATTINSTLGVTGATTLGSSLSVAGNTTLNGELVVDGDSRFEGAATFNSPVYMNSYNYLNGPTYLANLRELHMKDASNVERFTVVPDTNTFAANMGSTAGNGSTLSMNATAGVYSPRTVGLGLGTTGNYRKVQTTTTGAYGDIENITTGSSALITNTTNGSYANMVNKTLGSSSYILDQAGDTNATGATSGAYSYMQLNSGSYSGPAGGTGNWGAFDIYSTYNGYGTSDKVWQRMYKQTYDKGSATTDTYRYQNRFYIQTGGASVPMYLSTTGDESPLSLNTRGVRSGVLLDTRGVESPITFLTGDGATDASKSYIWAATRGNSGDNHITLQSFHDKVYIRGGKGVLIREGEADATSYGSPLGTPNIADVGTSGSYVSPAGASGSLDAEGYRYFEINPRYTSVMNDIKLASRGGARLSDLLGDFIIKGVYEMNNSYIKNSAIKWAYGGNATDVIPNTVLSYSGGAFTEGTNACTTNNCSEWLGFIPAPVCPKGYYSAVTMVPKKWLSARPVYARLTAYDGTGTPVVDNVSATDVNDHMSPLPGRTTVADDSWSTGSDTGYRLTKPAGYDLIGITGNYVFTGAASYCTSSTALNSGRMDCASYADGGANTFWGWSGVMGAITPINNNYYWNSWPYIPNESMAATANVYCVFLRKSPGGGDIWNANYVDTGYDQINNFRYSLGTSMPTAFTQRNDASLGYTAKYPWQ